VDRQLVLYQLYPPTSGKDSLSTNLMPRDYKTTARLASLDALFRQLLLCGEGQLNGTSMPCFLAKLKVQVNNWRSARQN
jgi:hypothetical protein